MDEAWYPECRARLLDRKGRLIWSATPQAGTEQLFQLHERALEEEALRTPVRSVEEFKLLIAENKHMDAGEREAFVNDPSMTPDQHRVRVEGEFAYLGFRIYPEFTMQVHGVDWFPVPDDWTRYMVVDPGAQVCAALFAAVPPRGHDLVGRVVLYDELYIQNCIADKFAEAAAHKTRGSNFEAFIVDYHGSIRSDGGSGETILQQYMKAMRRHGVTCNATDSGFQFGNDDVEAGIEAVKDWLRVRQETGTPRLAVVRGKLPALEREFKYYRRQMVNGRVIDKPVKKDDHALDALRYLAMFNPRYVKPRKPERAGGVYKAFLEWRKQGKKRGDSPYVRLGPPQR